MKYSFSTKTATRQSQLIALLRIGLFAIAALWIFGGLGSSYDLFRYYAADSWPQHTAQVISSRASKVGRMNKYCYMPHITYQYEFQGQVQKSDTWGFQVFNCASVAFAASVVHGYPAGKSVPVFVHPHSGLAVLNPDTTALWLITLAGIISCVLIWLLRPKNSAQKT